MKPYNQLTQRGKIRRLRPLVFKALEQYDLAVRQVQFFVIETNTMFKVTAEDGEKYMLRIYSDADSTLENNMAEMFWLEALARDTNLGLSVPVARRDGTYISVVSVKGVPGPRRCALYHWVPGRPLEERLTAANYAKLGQAMAKLHLHARSLGRLPTRVRPKRWDRVFYYPDEPVVYNKPEFEHLYAAECVQILNRVVAIGNTLLAGLYASKQRPILIHGDLHYWNVHVHQGRLYLIDFDDIMLGFPVQDVAVTLSYGRDKESYPELRAAFERGYRSLRPWPIASEKQLETLTAARIAMFTNYVAQLNEFPAAEYIELRCQLLEQFLTKYG